MRCGLQSPPQGPDSAAATTVLGTQDVLGVPVGMGAESGGPCEGQVPAKAAQPPADTLPFLPVPVLGILRNNI